MGESSREEICALEQTLLGLGPDRFLLGPHKQGAQLRQALELRAKYCQRLPPKRSAWKEDTEQFVKQFPQHRSSFPKSGQLEFQWQDGLVQVRTWTAFD